MMNLVFHLKGFLNKAAQRGVGYPIALLKYYLSRNWYHIKLALLEGRRLNSNGVNIFFRDIDSNSSEDILVDYFTERKSPVFHFYRDIIGTIVEQVPGALKDKTIAEANKILEQRFTFRNIGEHKFDGDVDWSYTPKNSISWLWDLNRHSYFLDLARAYYYTNEDQYIRHMVTLWESWIVQNPVSKTVNWATPFEVASRLNNWIWSFFFLVYSGIKPSAPLGKFLASMCDHAEYLYYNLEYHWPNNHLFLESKTLFEFSLLFPEVINQEKYFRRSESVFKDQVTSQILPDGGHSELSSMYHLIVAGELLEIASLAKRNRIPVAEAFEAQLLGSLKFSRAMVRDDGSMTLLGDSATEDNNIRFSPARVGLSDLNYWLLNEAQTELLPPNAKKKGLSVEVFPYSGYAFIRNESGDRKFSSTFDFGAFSRNPAADHAHNDALSFDLYALGRQIIIDPGVCFSSAPGAIPHDYFRGTAAHNTVMIDDREQSQIWRKSDVRKKAKVSLHCFHTTPERVEIEASCVPYWTNNSKIIHTRKINYLLYGRVEVIDHISGTGNRNLKWFFHFGPDIEITTHGNDEVSGFDEKGDPIFTLLVSALKRPDLSIVRGSIDPFQGWMSFNSSEVKAISTAIYEIRVGVPFRCNFEFNF